MSRTCSWLIASFYIAFATAGYTAPITNADILKLLTAGLSEGAVVATIKANGGTFDTSADALIALKKAGATDGVLQAVLLGNGAGALTGADPSSGASSKRAKGSASPGSGGACVPEAPDGYIIMVVDGKTRNLSHRKATIGSDVNGMSAIAGVFTFGLVPTTGTVSAVVRGSRAALRIKDRQPEFRDLASTAGTHPSGSWILARVDVGTNERTVQMGTASVSLLGGSTTRDVPRDDQVVALDYETVNLSCEFRGMSLALFAARPAQPLAPGEYMLFSPDQGIVYDFGVE